MGVIFVVKEWKAWKSAPWDHFCMPNLTRMSANGGGYSTGAFKFIIMTELLFFGGFLSPERWSMARNMLAHWRCSVTREVSPPTLSEVKKGTSKIFTFGCVAGYPTGFALTQRCVRFQVINQLMFLYPCVKLRWAGHIWWANASQTGDKHCAVMFIWHLFVKQVNTDVLSVTTRSPASADRTARAANFRRDLEAT